MAYLECIVEDECSEAAHEGALSVRTIKDLAERGNDFPELLSFDDIAQLSSALLNMMMAQALKASKMKHHHKSM